ncbi:hypothetical protein [Rahnella sp. PCH160]|uniref:hypothetical protein n=1 Tax=Rahnella sp. PCH160 TaxID=3447928 RepID=UPI0039FCA8DD
MVGVQQQSGATVAAAALAGIAVVIFFRAGDPRRCGHVQLDALLAVCPHNCAGVCFDLGMVIASVGKGITSPERAGAAGR